MSETDFFAVIEATWPPERRFSREGWTLRAGAGGGNRVSAATAEDEAPDLAVMEAAQAELGQPPVVMVRPGEEALDARLAQAGYAAADHTLIYAAPCAGMVAEPPRVVVFTVEGILQAQVELWAEGGIGAARLAIMERCAGPKTSILARCDDTPAAAAHLACAGDTAMLHALEVAPGFRRRGLARHIMGVAAGWAQDQGCTQISVAVTQANAGARALYASLGMQVVGHYHYRKKPTA